MGNTTAAVGATAAALNEIYGNANFGVGSGSGTIQAAEAEPGEGGGTGTRSGGCLPHDRPETSLPGGKTPADPGPSGPDPGAGNPKEPGNPGPTRD